MDYIVHGVTKRRTQLSNFHFHTDVLSILLTMVASKGTNIDHGMGSGKQPDTTEQLSFSLL